GEPAPPLRALGAGRASHRPRRAVRRGTRPVRERTVMRVQQYGLEADLPTGWEARIYRRDRASAARARADAASEPPSAPILHAANFPLPEDRGDFGSGAVDRMRSPHVFFALVEYEPEAAGTPLFAASGPPWPLDPSAFGPAQL